MQRAIDPAYSSSSDKSRRSSGFFLPGACQPHRE